MKRFLVLFLALLLTAGCAAEPVRHAGEDVFDRLTRQSAKPKKDAEPQSARDEPQPARDEPQPARDEPQPARDEPQPARDEPRPAWADPAEETPFSREERGYGHIGGELNLLNWGEYMDPAVIADFEAQTGVRVNLTEIYSEENMLWKLRTADGAYDLCFPSNLVVQTLIREELLLPLDPERIPNRRNADGRLQTFTDSFDPGGRYTLPYMWGILGILYNTETVQEAPDSWDVLWDRTYKGQIWMPDSGRDALAVALLRLGYDPNSQDPGELNDAGEALVRQIPLLKGLGSDNIRASMINRKAAVAVMHSGDALSCMEEEPALAFTVPREGGVIWFDVMAIPRTARNVDAAYAFLDYLNGAEAAAQNAEYILYPTPNAAARDRIDPALANNEVFNPSDDTLARCRMLREPSDGGALYDQVWAAYKADWNLRDSVPAPRRILGVVTDYPPEDMPDEDFVREICEYEGLEYDSFDECVYWLDLPWQQIPQTVREAVQGGCTDVFFSMERAYAEEAAAYARAYPGVTFYYDGEVYGAQGDRRAR